MKTAMILLAGLLVAACTSNSDVRRPPDYAVMLNSTMYQVMCPNLGVREIYVRFDAIDTFYHADGRAKTRDEFCAESATGAQQQRN